MTKIKTRKTSDKSLIDFVMNITKLVKEIPNDTELGKEIRKFINKNKK